METRGGHREKFYLLVSRLKVLLFILVIATGVTNFIVKQDVQGLDDQLAAVRKQTVAEQKKIHELTADWTYLNQPQLLTDLNNKYVHLQGMSPKQVISGVETIGLNESLGAPSARAMQKLMADIEADASTVSRARSSFNFGEWLSDKLSSFSPRTLAWSATAAALAIVLQAGLLAGMFVNDQQGGATFGTISRTVLPR